MVRKTFNDKNMIIEFTFSIARADGFATEAIIHLIEVKPSSI